MVIKLVVGAAMRSASTQPLLLFIIGTRPEAIKLAPVILACRRSGLLDAVMLNTGQQRQSVDETLAFFDLAADHHLSPEFTDGVAMLARNSRMVAAIADHMDKLSGLAGVVVQGDTLSALSGAMAGHLCRLPVFHVEAGLRSDDLDDPWPEEGNRRSIAALARLHLAPTPAAGQNLRHEGIGERWIHVTGNSGTDALHIALNKLRGDPTAAVAAQFGTLPSRLILATLHRRHQKDDYRSALATALSKLADDGLPVFFIQHVHGDSQTALVASLSKKVRVLPAQPYPAFIDLLRSAACVITDSGGVQEDAVELGRPLLILRANTERQEALTHGAELLTADPDAIGQAVMRSLASARSFAEPAAIFGDGSACHRIVAAIDAFFCEQINHAGKATEF